VIAYYQQLADVRMRLSALGHAQLADKLLRAERSASTSGEALDNTGVVLRSILDGDVFDDTELRNQLQALYDEGDRIWGGGTTHEANGPPIK
jgi:hypothetical protein